MKHIIIFFLLFSTAVSSQNYHYALDEAKPVEDTENPTNPLNLVATNVTQTTVYLSWSASTDNVAVTNYRVYNNGTQLLTSAGNVTNFTVTGLSPNTIYNLTVRAVDASNNESSNSNNQGFTTIPAVTSDTTAPTAPLNLIASNITETTVDLSWTASTDNIAVAGYNIYNNFSLINSVGNITNFSLTGLNQNSNYNIFIRAFDAAGNESTDSNVENFTTNASVDTEAPTAPINLVASNITETTVDLSWTASTDNVSVVDYQIYNNGDLLIPSTGGAGTTFALTGLSQSTTYNITVRAMDAAGNKSGDSNLQTVTTSSSQYTSTRFIMMGDSYTYSLYYFEDQIEAQINESFPNETVEVVMMGSPGESIDSYATGSVPNVDSFLATVEDIPTVQTFCIVMLGVNDARVKLYEDLTQAHIDTKIANLNYIIDAIEAKGFTPVLLDAPFANFQPSTEFPNNLGPAYDDESKGTKPYNDNIIIPTILSRTPEFAFADGQSYMQPYTLMYNGHPDYTGDGVHPAGGGNTALKQGFVDTIVNYIFTGQVPTKILKNGSLPNNQTCEDDYFDTYYVPSSEAANLQSLLNTHGSVRLGAGNFSAAGNITIGSNQSIYGYPSQDGTELGTGNITISAGSSNVIIKNVDPNNIIFEAGSEISNVTINHVAKADIDCIGCRLTDSKIINVFLTEINFDNSVSGYVRNTQIIRAYAQAQNDHVRWLGNTSEPSYNNIELSRNFLTSSQNTSNYDTLESHTLLGTDSEYWDATGTSTRGPYYFRNCGQVNIFNSYGFSSPASSPEFDIEADLVWMQRKFVGSNQTPIFRTGTDVLYVQGDKNPPNYEGNNNYIEAYHGDDNIIFNGSNLSTTITGVDATTLRNMIYRPKYTPISKPSFKNLCDPTGPNWSTDRVGQTDQSAAIQNLIDTNGIAELDEGIYYISQPILVKSGQGIIGKGTGKTAIVGITDDFPLIKVNDVVTSAGQSTGQHHVLSYLTLQGGSIGYHVSPVNSHLNVYMISNNAVNNVVFRNQTDGIRIEKIHGYDNNFFDSVSFVDCTNGIMQIPSTVEGVNDTDVTYVDKTVFFNCQFINNTTALNMDTIRANNLNAWINCNFDGNGIVFNTTQSNALYVANSVFKNGTGSAVMTGNARMSLYGCDFYNNRVSSLFNGKRGIYGEGCNFNDSGVDFFGTAGYEKDLFLWNSNVQSTINLSIIEKGLLINNNVSNNSALTKPMVEVIKGVPLTILDGTVDVYPQLLVKR